MCHTHTWYMPYDLWRYALANSVPWISNDRELACKISILTTKLAALCNMLEHVPLWCGCAGENIIASEPEVI